VADAVNTIFMPCVFAISCSSAGEGSLLLFKLINNYVVGWAVFFGLIQVWLGGSLVLMGICGVFWLGVEGFLWFGRLMESCLVKWRFAGANW
jgi:hypothetical protein